MRSRGSLRAGLSAVVVAAGLCLAAAPLVAEAPAPFPEFTFKRIGVPTPGTARRITVQIAPAAVAPVLPEVALARAPSPGSPQVDAFWSAIGTGMDGAGPARLAAAVTEIDRAGLEGPTLQSLQGLAQLHGRDLLAASIDRKVSPALALAVIAVESAGATDAVSRAGAQGLMQLMPATAERFGVADSLNATQNIGGGIAYLDWLMREFDGDPILALAGYNAGENAVKRAGGVPDYAETRAYVPKVIAAWTVARGLCLTPPELASDGCVFASLAAR